MAAEWVGAVASVLVFHALLMKHLRRPFSVDGKRAPVTWYRVQEVRVIVLHVCDRWIVENAGWTYLRCVR